EKSVELWSPFNKFPARTIPNTPEGTPDVAAIHTAAMEIKSRFPDENQVVIAPYAGLSYDPLISVMDAVRAVEDTDPPLFRENKETGIQEEVKLLFNEIVFGNLLGD